MRGLILNTLKCLLNNVILIEKIAIESMCFKTTVIDFFTVIVPFYDNRVIQVFQQIYIVSFKDSRKLLINII